MNTLELNKFDEETQEAVTAIFDKKQSNGFTADELIQTQAGIALVIDNLDGFHAGDTGEALKLLNKYYKDSVADFRITTTEYFINFMRMDRCYMKTLTRDISIQTTKIGF